MARTFTLTLECSRRRWLRVPILRQCGMYLFFLIFMVRRGSIPDWMTRACFKISHVKGSRR